MFGRNRLVSPNLLCRSLLKAGGPFKDAAMSTFAKMRDRYHPICSKMLKADLGVAQ